MKDFIVWGTDPTLFSLGGYSLRYYSLFFALGVTYFIFFVSRAFRQAGFTEKRIDGFLFLTFFAMIVGARLGHVLFYSPGYYFSNPWEIPMVWKGGLASHGAGIAMLLSTVYFSRKYAIPYHWLLDRGILPVFFTGGLIRIGNFFNSEIVGNVSEVPWAIVFSRIDSLPRHPVQLYESILYFALVIGGWAFDRKPNLRNRPWFMSGFFLTGAFLGRAMLELFKTQQSSYESFLGISTGQWLSVPFILAGTAMLYVSFKKEPVEFVVNGKKKPKKNKPASK